MICVSVITPTYNSKSCIARCVESINTQTYPNIEHIVIDGGSTDGTLELLRELGVRCISEPDAGIYHAMNKGIRLATGEIVHILNSDDSYSGADVIATMVEMMESGKYDLCHAQISQVDAKGNEVCVNGANVEKAKLLKKMKVAHPSCFVRASVYHRFGDFSQGFRVAGDYDFILRVWGKVKVGFLPRRIVKMQMDGMSSGNPVRSYKESMAVTLTHGRGVIPALFTFCYECIKHYAVMFVRQKQI